MCVEYIYQVYFDKTNKTKPSLFLLLRKEHTEAGKTTQSLRAFVALAKGLGLGPSTHTAAQSAGSRVSDTLFCFLRL